MGGLIRITLVILLALAGARPALAESKVALLIGNESYAGLARLANPVRDVTAMEGMLRRAGFTTRKVTNAGRSQMVEAMRAFEAQAEGADIALVFYSGHGLEMDGRNYLLPVDALLKTDRDVEDETIPLSRLLRTTEGARRLKLVILDACRDNPLVRSMGAKTRRAVNRGLAAESGAATDMLIAYATAEKATAEDGSGSNSPFTAALVQHLAEPGVDVRIALGNVRDAVRNATDDRQIPHMYGSLGGGTIALAGHSAMMPPRSAPAAALTGPALPLAPPPPVASTPDPCTHAEAHWRQTKEFDRPDLYEEHLRLFSRCAFASFARAKIEERRTSRTVSIPPEPVQAPKMPRSYRIRSDVSLGYLNMRSGPGQDHRVVVKIPAGSSGVTLGACRSPDDGKSSFNWCNAKWRSYSGWISRAGVLAD